MTDTHDWNATEVSYSGDVTVDGGETAPVGVAGLEDCYVEAGAVTGDLRVLDAEYVYTAEPTGDAGAVDPATELTGDLEDGYLRSSGVDGDAVLADVEDVFVAPAAVEGDLELVGAENVFRPGDETTRRDPSTFDLTVAGWQRSTERSDPSTGLTVLGARNDVTVTDVPDGFEVLVVGWQNEVRVEGSASDVRVSFVGHDNHVGTGPFVDAERGGVAGGDNALERDDYPVERLIETTKSEAFGRVTLGRSKVTYQEPAPDEEWCPNCGAEASAVVARRQRDSLFVLGYPVFDYEVGAASYECEQCSPRAGPDVKLSAEERKEVLG